MGGRVTLLNWVISKKKKYTGCLFIDFLPVLEMKLIKQENIFYDMEVILLGRNNT
jgi:hypothetical protein